MVTISILKNKKVTNYASFENEELADIWLKEELANNSFGDRETFEIKVEYK